MPPPGTARVHFRPFSTGDEEAVIAVICDPEVMKYSDHGAYAPAQVAGWIAKQRDPAAYGGPPFGRWAVIETSTDQVIGFAILSRHPDRSQPDEAEIGYRLAKAFWGKGYGTEVARALIALGLALPGIRRIIAIVDPANAASLRVLEKAGMTVAGELLLPHYDHPDLVYEIPGDG